MLQDLDIIKAYYTMFGRAPEKDGFEYWKNEATTKGWDLSELVNTFLKLPVVQEAGYPSNQTAESYVANLYATLFGKNPDDGGYWAGKLNAGMSKGDLLSTMVQAALGTPDGTNGKDTLLNKLSFSQYIVALQQNNNVSLDPAQLKLRTEAVNELSDTVADAIKHLADDSGYSLNLFPKGTISNPDGLSFNQIIAAIKAEVELFKRDLSDSQGEGSPGDDDQPPHELLPDDLGALLNIIALDNYTGQLSLNNLRQAVIAETGQTAYNAAFDVSGIAEAADGVLSPDELGTSKFGSLPATSETLESLFYGTLINALKNIDSTEIAQISSFISNNAATLQAEDPAIISQYINLMANILTTPASSPIFSDEIVAQTAIQSGVAYVSLVGQGDNPALFDGLLAGFLP